MSHHLVYVEKWWWENFPLDTIFLSKLWQVFWKLQLIENDDQTKIFFHKKFETLRTDHLVWLTKKFCYTHYSLYQKSFTHIFIKWESWEFYCTRDLSRDDCIEEFIKRKWSSGLVWAAGLQSGLQWLKNSKMH